MRFGILVHQWIYESLYISTLSGGQ